MAASGSDRSRVAVTDLEARAEQLVDAFVRAIEAADDYACSPRDYAEAVLNVVRTEREMLVCRECGGSGYDSAPSDWPDEFTAENGPGPCQRCDGSGSVPGELLVVGLIGGEE